MGLRTHPSVRVSPRIVPPAPLPDRRQLDATLLQDRQTIAAAGGVVTARQRGQQLATQRGVALETICADASQWDYPEAHFDLIVLFYFHLPREPAKVAHRGCLKALKPGGRLILEGFRKEQMPLLSGGPRVEDWMYSAEEINEDFGTLDARINRAVGRVLREGRLRGSAAVYQYVGHKAE